MNVSTLYHVDCYMSNIKCARVVNCDKQMRGFDLIGGFLREELVIYSLFFFN